MAKILIAALLAVAALGRLTIYSPSDLREEINRINGTIRSSISNFGITPYGHSVIGNVWIEEQNLNGCKAFETKIDGSWDPDTDPSPIVIVERGGCSFVTKVRNIEHAGGKLALVIDEKDEDIENVIMVDDGNGNGIRIPSMMISKKDGNIIKKFLLEDKRRIALMATFEMDKPDNRVEYDFWYTSSDDRALDFLRDFKENHL